MATNPTLLTMPIAENGQKNTIPATQAAAGDGLLSQSTGFPPETALPLGAGGKAPTREDFNGAFNLLSNIAFYAQKGWTFEYDATQDYYKGCVVIDPADGNRYECIADMPVADTIAPHSDTNNDYWKAFSLGGGVPVGFIMPYAGTGLQEGWLDCDGSAVSRTMYPDLFAAIGTTWGAGDESTTFNLPNLIDAAMLNGSYTKTTFTAAGSATFTAPKSGFYKITVKGGGGGGRGGQHNGTTYSCGGGGGGEGGTSVGYERMTAGDTASVVVGAGGAGGAANGGNGANGGDSTVIINLSTYTGGGGAGGDSIYRGGAGGAGTIPGASGGSPSSSNGTYANTGASGGAGGGAGGGATDRNGVNGGGGGGGSVDTLGANSAGGKGGDGYVWFEYVGVTPKFLIKAFDGQTADSALIDLTQYAQDLANRLTREMTPAFNRRDVITTSGTYTAPVTGWYRIEVKGGGAGGRSGSTSSSNIQGGSGGGEGGITIGWEYLYAGDTVPVVVGAGGAGGVFGTNDGYGANGGNSSATVGLNTYTGGGGSNYLTGGTGTIPGAPGTPGAKFIDTTGMYATGGVGGGNGGAATSIDTATNGGGGNGGRANYVGTIRQNGGAGGDGYVAFEYFAPALN